VSAPSVQARVQRDGGRVAHDRGAVVFLVSLIMLTLLVVAALVVDLGMSRHTRRDAQLSADLAATAAGWVLAGNGQESIVSDPQAACLAAVDSIVANVPRFPSAGASEMRGLCASLPADAANCPATTPPPLTTTLASPYTLLIQYPVDDADIERPSAFQSFDDGIRCERMKVVLQRDDPAIFSRVLGDDGRTVQASAVVKAGPSNEGDSVPALLMLERERCGVIQVSGQGAIWVKASNGQPGIMHSDSAAQTTGSCTTNTNAGGNNVYGTAMPNGEPSLRADGVGTTAGRIQMYSLAGGVGGRGGYYYRPGCNWIDAMVLSCEGSGLTSQPIGGRIVSRAPVDAKYGDNIASLYSAARQRVLWNWGQAQAAGFGVRLSGGDCNADNRVYGTDDTAATSRVYVDCATFSGSNVVFNAREVVFNGRLEVQGGYVAFPNVRRLHVRGCTNGANCAGIEIKANGILAVNSGTTQLAPPATWPVGSCLAARPPGDPSQNWTELALFGGRLSAGGGGNQLQLCQTVGLLSYDTGPTYSRIQRTTGGNCSAARPCPADTLPSGVPDLKPLFESSNSTAVYWTAPNRGSEGPTAYGGDSPFEDLAIWTEAIGITSSTRCSLSGQAAFETGGVVFYPNCDFTYTGQSSNNVPFNAQFIGRSINLSGQGLLSMMPNQQDSVLIPTAGRVYLIR
jgi:hypothetical protein